MVTDPEAAELRQAAETVLRHLDARKSDEKKDTLVRKFVEEVSLMGLSEAVRAKHPCVKIMWAMVFVTCLGTGTYFVYQVFDEFLSDPTATKVSVTRREQYPFPPMTLCVDTWLNAEKAMRMGLTQEAIHYALSYLLTPYDIMAPIAHFSNSSTARAEFEAVFERENFTNLIDFFQAISLDAAFSGKFLSSVVQLATDDDIEFSCVYCMGYRLRKVLMDHGICYQLEFAPTNGRGLRQSYAWHEIVLRVPDLSMGMQSRKSYWSLYIDPIGTKLISSGQFITIEVGRTYSIRAETIEYHMLNKPDEPCIDKDEDKRHVNYTAITCSLDCVSSHFRMLFDSNCTVFNLASVFNRNVSEYCNTYYMDQWRVPPRNELVAGSQIVSDCAAGCISECNFTRYHTIVDGHVSRGLMGNQSRADGNVRTRNVTAAKMYFIQGDLLAGGVLIFSEVYTYSFETLVGNIGGTCGIWIGASTLTFIQVLTFWSKHCLYRGKKAPPIRKLTKNMQLGRATL